jgi:hypothetical protein
LKDLVVLKRHPTGLPTGDQSAGAPTEEATAQDDSPTANSQESASTPLESAYETKAIPLAALDLHGTANKLRRYLDATRSAMLFGPRVILVEGIAEALLLPVFARGDGRVILMLGYEPMPPGQHPDTYTDLLEETGGFAPSWVSKGAVVFRSRVGRTLPAPPASGTTTHGDREPRLQLRGLGLT